jgi:hypothetical protein
VGGSSRNGTLAVSAIIGFAVFAPLEHPNPDFVTLHAVQQVVCTGTFLLMDSVPEIQVGERHSTFLTWAPATSMDDT